MPKAAQKPEEIEARIQAEESRLKSEERREAELTEQRVEPLAAGDDAALDAIEQQIDQSRTSQVRILERIRLLETQASEARKQAKEAQKTRMHRRVQELQQEVEARALEYDKAAKAAAEHLAHVAALDGAIALVKRRLEKLGDVTSYIGSRALRCYDGWIVPEQVVEEVQATSATVEHGANHNLIAGKPVSRDNLRVFGRQERITVRSTKPARREGVERHPVIHSVANIPGAGHSPASYWTPAKKPDEALVHKLAEVPEE